MSKIARVEYTSNPNIVNFVLKELLIPGFPKVFKNKESVESFEFAKSLFALYAVTEILIKNNFITIAKREEAQWNDLLPKLATKIRAFKCSVVGLVQ